MIADATKPVIDGPRTRASTGCPPLDLKRGVNLCDSLSRERDRLVVAPLQLRDDHRVAKLPKRVKEVSKGREVLRQ